MPLFQQAVQKIPSNLLKDRYSWPPFSILNTISWDWQRRVDDWKNVILDSGNGRDVKRYNATPTNTFSSRGSEAKEAESISIFDPYLCELMYRWFSIPGMTILDPFAGGCVRGEVAAVLNRRYTGIDLSPAQVDANKEAMVNLQSRYSGISGSAEWLCGDSDEILSSLVHTYDMVLTCPPYFNLEQYTKDKRDLSRLPTYEDFLIKYESILKKTAEHLNEDCFFVIVVSEVRKNQQNLAESQYLGLVPDTIHILKNSCFLHYYNELILENNIGSLPIRVPRSFERTRKIGRHHQNILVFYKGHIENIEQKFGRNIF